MTNLEKLQGMLKQSGIDISDAQASALAVRKSGSVDAYLASMQELASRPLPKMSDTDSTMTSPKWTAAPVYEVVG